MAQTTDVWTTALNMMQQWEQMTSELEICVKDGDVETLMSLLDQREQLGGQLDALKAQHGVSSWVSATDQKDQPMVAQTKAKIQILGKQLLQRDVQIRTALQAKMEATRTEYAQLRQQKQLNQAYQSPRVMADGVFIDWKR